MAKRKQLTHNGKPVPPTATPQGMGFVPQQILGDVKSPQFKPGFAKGKRPQRR
jgi:hypothetical protein